MNHLITLLLYFVGAMIAAHGFDVDLDTVGTIRFVVTIVLVNICAIIGCVVQIAEK